MMGLLSDWEQPVLEWFGQFGPASLAALAFSEAIIQPIPPDLMLLPLLVKADGNVATILWLWISVTLASVLGSVVGYWLGANWGKSLLDKFANPKHVAKLEVLTTRYGTSGVFIAALSPIPYKVFGWVAGMGEMDKRSFIIAGLWGRGLRFGIEAVLIGLWGQQMLDFLMGWGFFLVSFLAALCLIPLWLWWQSLEADESSQSVPNNSE
jgi:undecaprenyl-diphosphatase